MHVNGLSDYCFDSITDMQGVHQSVHMEVVLQLYCGQLSSNANNVKRKWFQSQGYYHGI